MTALKTSSSLLRLLSVLVQTLGEVAAVVRSQRMQLLLLLKNVQVLKTLIRAGKIRVYEVLELARVTALQHAAEWTDRLSTLRDRLNETVGEIPLITVMELHEASKDLREEFEAVLLHRKFGSKLRQVELQIGSDAARIRQLGATVELLQTRVRSWANSLRSLAGRYNRAADEVQGQRLQQYREVATEQIQQKSRAFAHFLATPSIDILCREYLLQQALSDFATTDVSIMDAALWLAGQPERTVPAQTLVRNLLGSLRTVAGTWVLEAVFIVIPPTSSGTRIDRTRLHLLPSISSIRVALQSLRRVGISQAFVLLNVEQLLIQSQIVAFDSAGRIKPFSSNILPVPAGEAHSVVLARIEEYGYALKRSLLNSSDNKLSLQLLNAKGRNVKVLIAYLGERPVTQMENDTLLKPHSINYSKMAGASAMRYLSLLRTASPEVQQMVTQVKQELRYFTTMERSCRQPIISAKLTPGLRQLLQIDPPQGGRARIIPEYKTAVLTAFSRLSLPALPLSAFFRSSVALLQVDMGRSRFGRREYVVPPAQSLMHALWLLLSYPVEGEVAAKICTRVVRDSRFGSLRGKRGSATVFLISGVFTPAGGGTQVSCVPPPQAAVVAGTVDIADFFDPLQTRSSILETITDRIAKNFLPQHFIEYMDKLEGLVIYVQLMHH